MTTMDFEKTLQAVRRLKVETGSLACSGCGMEHSCGVRGCAILRNAAEHMEVALERYDHWGRLIDQQEAELKSYAKLLSASETARAELAQRLALAQKELQEAKSERDALLQELANSGACRACVHVNANPDCDCECLECKVDCPCRECRDGSHFVWRGLNHG